ncbi:MAG: HD domain-containing protein [Crenarchaeota archaeon]|nr:HD domain-containing protein [Thermoproteota archaeon]
MKFTPRTGWMLRGVPAAIAETVSMHSHESSIIAVLLADTLRRHGVEVDPYRAATIAALHDAAEALVGDIVKRAVDAIGREVKEKLEAEAAAELFGRDSTAYRAVMSYIEQTTIEARVAKAAETLSTLIQGLRYVRQGYSEVREIVCSMYTSLNRMGTQIRSAVASLFPSTLKEAERLCTQQGDPDHKGEHE